MSFTLRLSPSTALQGTWSHGTASITHISTELAQQKIMISLQILGKWDPQAETDKCDAPSWTMSWCAEVLQHSRSLIPRDRSLVLGFYVFPRSLKPQICTCAASQASLTCGFREFAHSGSVVCEEATNLKSYLLQPWRQGFRIGAPGTEENPRHPFLCKLRCSKRWNNTGRMNALATKNKH